MIEDENKNKTILILEKLLFEHKRMLTDMMLRTENMEAAIELSRQGRVRDAVETAQTTMPPLSARPPAPGPYPSQSDRW